MSKQTVIIGEGWAALAALVGCLTDGTVTESAPVLWLSGSGGRVVPSFPSLESHEAAEILEGVMEFLDLPIGPRLAGASFVREFRNKGFREPAWQKGAELAEKREIRAVELWAPECALVPVDEVRWELSLVEIEEQIRTRLLQHPAIQRRAGIPVEGFRFEGGDLQAVVLSSGEAIEAARVIYADRWSGLGRLTGLPKAMDFLKGREPMGVLQAVFTHANAMLPQITEGFFSVLNRESGDSQDKQIFGHFYKGGLESVWTTAIAPEEGEDNHLIAKRLRRMKQALEKIFGQTEWIPEGLGGEFSRTIKNEHVRYEEGFILSSGTAPEAALRNEKGAQAIRGIEFVTDGYGVGPALLQVLQSSGLKPSVQA